jgi:hypothetical protein
VVVQEVTQVTGLVVVVVDLDLQALTPLPTLEVVPEDLDLPPQ